MEFAKNKTAAIAIAIFLIISMSASMLLIPNNTASAHTPPYQITTYAGVTIQPDPIGLGQSGLGYAFLRNAPLSGATIENTFRNHNYTVYIVAPSGNKTTLHWDTVVDTTSVQFFRFTPAEVGQYNITFVYGGNILNSTYFDTTTSTSVGDVWLPSTATCTLQVQQDPVTQYPDSYPLPTQWWTRPIYGENNYWYTIASDWFGVGSPCLSDVSYGTITTLGGSQSAIQRYPGDAVGSLTSHVMWTKALQEGGVVGNNRTTTTGDTYFEGSAYNNRYINPIIMYGMLFYREPIALTQPSSGASICLDLRTGEVIWDRTDLPTISFGYTFDVQSPNQHGVYPAWLCTSNFAQIYDMWTGTSIANVTGTASGFSVLGTSGEWLKYNIYSNATNGYFLTIWNSSKMFAGEAYTGTGNTLNFDTNTYHPTGLYAWVNTTSYVNGVLTTTSVNTTQATVTAINATLSKRYEILNSTLDNNVPAQNISLPWRNAMTTTPTVLAVKYNDYMICRNGSYPSLTGVTQNVSNVISLTSANWTYFKVDINRTSSTFGQVLWWGPTITHLQNETITWGGFDPVAQVVFEVSKETQNIWGYGTDNTNKGAFLWATNSVNAEQQQNITVLDYFGMPMYPYYATQPAYGNVYCLAYGGVLYCYNLTTGIRTWSNGNGETPGNNTDAGVGRGYYPQLLDAVGNGVIYTVASQHTIITPIYKGQMARAINATDGTEIWQLSDYTGEFSGTSYAMADGYNNWFNGYDNQIYTVGRGPSTTTVTAPNLAAASGQSVVISGTVYDVSAGASQTQQAADFANGLPCAADSSMTDWMGYVYQQKPMPTNFTGVTVNVNVIDANGNYRSIGNATTDATGAYSLIWTPDIPGSYQVTANFAGTQGYWPSTATTAFTVMEAAAATAAPTPTPTSVADMYFVPAIAGLFVVIIIIGAVLALLMLRKRP
jgi:hypothetical protein